MTWAIGVSFITHMKVILWIFALALHLPIILSPYALDMWGIDPAWSLLFIPLIIPTGLMCGFKLAESIDEL